ncbi:MAG: energy transducer TonB [Rhodospirillales bacterium]|nr:energy transducer TonB [Rhodospirillales bacterium]
MAARRHAALGLSASVALHGAALAAVVAFGNGWWGAALPVVGTAPEAAWPVVWVESEIQVRADSEPTPEPAPEAIQASVATQAPPPAPEKAQPKPKIKLEPAAVESVTSTLAAEPVEVTATNAEQKSEITPPDSPESSSADGTAPSDLAFAMALPTPATAPPASLGWSGEVRIPPVYPLAARRRGAQGEVLLRAEVGTDGVPTAITLLRGSGHAELDAAARAAVEKWRFRASSNFSVEIPIVFRLDGR